MKKYFSWMMAAILRQLVLTIVFCGATVLTACSNEDNGGTTDDSKARKALLIILDGWGIGDKGQDDAIAQTATPYMDYLKANYPNAELQASGGYVGLPDGQMGNSETGHLNIGAGRIVYQDLVKINRACADGSIRQNKEVVSAFAYASRRARMSTSWASPAMAAFIVALTISLPSARLLRNTASTIPTSIA